MSDTAASSESRIRVLLDDSDPSNYAINKQRMWDFMSRQIQEIGTRVGLGQVWISPAFTTVDGTSDYALPANEYAQLVVLKNVTRGWLIQKADAESIERMRQTGSTVFVKGIPTRFSMIESSTQVVTIRLYPVPNDAYVIDALVSTLPTRIASDADVIPFARDLMAAMEFRVAARCARLIYSDRMQKSLSGGAAVGGGWRVFRATAQAEEQSINDWMSDAESLIKEGIRRVNQIKRAANLERSVH